MGQPFLTVIFTSYNQKEILLKNLEAWNYIHKNQYNDFEIVIGDDGSDDGSIEAMKNFKTPYDKKVVYHKHEGRRTAKVKNMGIEAANGKYILVNDGDTFPDRTTIKILDSIEDDKTALMGIRWKFDFDKFKKLEYTFNWIRQCVIRDSDYRGKVHNIPPSGHRHYSGANVLYPAEMLKEIKWAPDDWVGFGYDDYYHALNWLIAGGKFKAMNDCIAHHVNHPNTVPPEETENRFIEYEREAIMQLVSNA